MSGHEAVYQWAEEVGARLPGLEPSQARALATFSYGMVLARSCALTAVSGLLAVLLGKRENTRRQYLRESVYEASAKRGHCRRQVAVHACFAPLLGWVLSLWEGRQMALALDATSLGDRFVVLVVSVVYRGCAIPVSWTVLPAGAKHTWRPEWRRLLRDLAAGRAAGLCGDRAGRPGAVCGLVVPPHRAAELASTPARQSGRDLPTSWRARLPVPARVCAHAGNDLAGHGHRLQDHATPPFLHAACALGTRPHRPLAAAD